MSKYAAASAKTGLGIPGPGSCPSDELLPRLVALTEEADPLVRRLALKHLCPCRLQRKRDDVWQRVFELAATDPDPGVRMDAVHAMTDGSPREFGPAVVAQLEEMRNDSDPKLRKHIRRTLVTIRRTGRVNVN